MEQFVYLVNQMSPYLLLGFLLAGLMHSFVPGRFYARYLSGNGLGSVVCAALFGIPLPLCSCGVIPTAMSLRKEGASKGATVSFLIATPQTGVDSILATYGLMGLPFAVVRPLASLVTAVFGGMAAGSGEKSAHSGNDCDFSDRPDMVGGGNVVSFMDKVLEALRYGYVTMMQDIGKWLAVGLVVATLITIFVPAQWFAALNGSTWASMLLVLCIAVPMYVCATGSIPIAVALMLKGLTPGAALVLLMAGPACNVASILVVRKVLGTRTLVMYLLSIVIGAVAFGALVDYLHFNGVVDFLGNITMGGACCVHESSWMSWLSTALLAALLVNALVLQKYNKTNQNYLNTSNIMRTFRIEGMNCNHCRMSAEKAILAVDGVTSAKVDLQEKKAYVEGNAADDTICKAVSEVGFDCSAI